MKSFTSLLVLEFVVLGLMGAHARADVYVVPPANTNTSGTGGTFTLLTDSNT